MCKQIKKVIAVFVIGSMTLIPAIAEAEMHFDGIKGSAHKTPSGRTVGTIGLNWNFGGPHDYSKKKEMLEPTYLTSGQKVAIGLGVVAAIALAIVLSQDDDDDEVIP